MSPVEQPITPALPDPHASVLAVIPARYASTRFPGKPLAILHGQPMVWHVWTRACRTPGLSRVVIATDDARIQSVCEDFGADVRMTSPDHPSGTDRLWEVARDLPDYSWVLNIQGDEPFIDPAHLQTLLSGRSRCPQADILTLVTPISDEASWRDPNMVKAVLAADGRALYFSRASIPYDRDAAMNTETSAQSTVPPWRHAFRHLGLYLYRREALAAFVSLPVSPLESLERLEQLRALEAGIPLFALPVDHAPVGVDTPTDLERLAEDYPSGFPYF